MDEKVITVIEQGYERIDGSGYPKGLKGEQIDESAQVIGLVDVYEALTHPRPYRKKYSSLEALKIIVKSNLFNPKLTKLFLERVGVYPRGFLVELNTKEVAQVIKQNPRMPSSPVVRVVVDLEGKKTQKTRVVDLADGTQVFITKSL